MLPKVWPAMEFLHANTVEIPVYWEQFEPRPGQFDYSVVDTLLTQARAHRLRLVLLWFATWKNGNPHYMPEWMKLAPERYPHVVDKDGHPVDSPSPFAAASLEADAQGLRRLDASPQSGGPAAHRADGAGGERTRHRGQSARLLSGRAEALRRPGPGRCPQGHARAIQHALRQLAGSLRPRRRGLLPQLGRGQVHRAGGRRGQGGLPAPALRQRRAGNSPLRGAAGSRPSRRAGQLRKRRPQRQRDSDLESGRARAST